MHSAARVNRALTQKGALPNGRSARSSPPESESRSSSLPVSLVESIVPVVLSEILDLFVPGTKTGRIVRNGEEKARINTHNAHEIRRPTNTLYCSTTHAGFTLTGSLTPSKKRCASFIAPATRGIYRSRMGRAQVYRYLLYSRVDRLWNRHKAITVNSADRADTAVHIARSEDANDY